MAQRSFPFDAGAGATISETDWQNMARRFRQTGVIEGSLSQLAVSADGSSLAVSVATGDAFVEGFFYRNDAALALTIAAANATNPRIDTVVVRLDRVANTAALAVVTGTPAASPVAPTLSTADSLYELPLANVLVPAAAGVIVAGNVTDRRTLTRTFDSAAYAHSGASAFLSADQSLPNGTLTVISLAGEDYDTANWHDTATNPSRMTVPTGVARVDVEAQVGYLANSTGRRSLLIRKNGVTVAVVNQNAVAGDASYLHAGKKGISVVAGDFFEMFAFQDSGAALSAQGGSALTWLTIKKVA